MVSVLTRLAGVIGYPVGHSVSPLMHQAAFNHYGLDARYEAWETPREELARRVQALRKPRYMGASVTVPHKEAVVGMVDWVEPGTQAIGAVNTVVNRNSSLEGYNTDGPGFLRSLREEGGFDPSGRCVLMLGAGGAARAVAYSLLEAGAASLVIANRSLERAQALAAGLGNGRIQTVPLRPEALAPHLEGSQLIVNCTSVGMRGGPAPERSSLEGSQIPSGALVYDLVYNPPITPLLDQARRAGARVLGGLGMLVFQGAEAFWLWTRLDPPIEVMYRAAREGLGLPRDYTD